MILEGKRILVTGGTGSMGKTLVRRLLTGEMGRPSRIIILSRDEAKQHVMRLAYMNRTATTDEVIYDNFHRAISFRIGDVRSYADVCGAMREADVVINAAAMKQVPTCEYFPEQAIATNCLGPANIVQALREHDYPVETVVGVSTDKACKPVNAMGMSKAMQERIFTAANIGVPHTRFVCVRYGNVLASRGSVIPLFLDQIARGGPVTVTVPDMTRFLLSLDVAVDTVFAALRLARAGETLVPRAPAATVINVATALVGDRGVPIRITGIRPGEKMDEIMVSDEEAPHGCAGRLLRHPADAAGTRRPRRPACPTGPPEGVQLRGLRARPGGHPRSPPPARPHARSGPGHGRRGDPRVTVPAGDEGRLKVMTIVGTRPEVIKLSRVIAMLDRHVDHVLVHSGQNYDPRLNEVFFRELEISRPRHFLGVAEPSVARTIGQVIVKSDEVLETEKPDALLLYGDTNTCLSVIPAKRRKIPIFHMEAGNRCFDQRVPEELNRKVVDHLSDINMPLTEHARRYLLAEGIRPETILKTGSTMREVLEHYAPGIDGSRILDELALRPGGYFLVSVHREENVDDPERLAGIVDTLRAVAVRHGRRVVVSTHPRTRVRLEKLAEQTRGLDAEGITFLQPFGFFDYIQLQKNAFCVISDSGTITEESALLGFPAVTIREAHERPEGMDAGTLVMSGLRTEQVLQAVDVVTSRAPGDLPGLPPDYLERNVSRKVLQIIQSYTGYVNRTVWQKSRG